MHHPKVHAGDYDARTALHIAACEGNTPMCMLLATGPHGRACVDAKDRWGKTAAEEAEREGHTKLSEQLKAKQAAEDPARGRRNKAFTNSVGHHNRFETSGVRRPQLG